MSSYYMELMKGHKPAPDLVCRICGHAIEDHEWIGQEDSEQGVRGRCAKPGCSCKKFQTSDEIQEET